MIRTWGAVFFFIVLAVGNASAWWGPFEIQNETCFDGDWGVVTTHGYPDKNVSSNKHIRGWVDIVGFENMSTVNGVEYINDSPHKVAIVKRDAWHTDVSGKVTSFDTLFSVVDTDYVNQKDTTTAIQHTTFKWKYKVCDGLDCHWVKVTEHLTITDTVNSPFVFNNSVSDYTITITSYNNSVTPYTLIYIPYMQNITKETVEYKNGIAQYHNKTGLVATNPKGTEYVKFINTSLHVEDTTHTVTRRSGYYVINEAPLDWGSLNISVCTPYVVVSDLNWSVTVVHSKPSDYVAWELMVVFVLTVMVFVVAVYWLVNRGRV